MFVIQYTFVHSQHKDLYDWNPYMRKISLYLDGAQYVPIIMHTFYILLCFIVASPDSKDHRANMGPTWVLSAPGGSHVGPMNLAITVVLFNCLYIPQCYYSGFIVKGPLCLGRKPKNELLYPRILYAPNIQSQHTKDNYTECISHATYCILGCVAFLFCRSLPMDTWYDD